MKHEIKRTYRYRLYPNEAQKTELARTFGCSRWVYNWALETKTEAYYQDEESLSFTDLSGRLTSKKKRKRPSGCRRSVPSRSSKAFAI
ncbi:transposase [Salinibacter ruber]|uniref:helix-turn-helix domain-containing protein n=1 Tax=Salinibacter ruber TaxID=146919 RepID=UPI002168A836|nr:transposase [Salinibacter ruber]